MPRLELLGALLAARLASKVKPIVDLKKPSKVFFWTDSKITLHWMKGSSKRWKSFVSNRVTEIQSLCDTSAWAHCPGKQNPVDFLSRGVNVEILLNSDLWWKGPQFLREVDFPTDTGNDDTSISLHDISDELKKTSDYSPLTLTILNHNSFIDDILKISNNYMSIIRVMCYVLRFIHNVKNIERLAGHLTKELQRAEIYLVQLVQQGGFAEKVKNLRKDATVPSNSKQRSKWMFSKNNVKLGALVLIKDENMPNVKWLTGRISEIIISKDEKARVVNVLLPTGFKVGSVKKLETFYPIGGAHDLCVAPSGVIIASTVSVSLVIVIKELVIGKKSVILFERNQIHTRTSKFFCDTVQQFSKPFEMHVESLCTDIHNDLKWSPDMRAIFSEVCSALKCTIEKSQFLHILISIYKPSDVSNAARETHQTSTVNTFRYINIQIPYTSRPGSKEPNC
ncbi:hypothetical protein AVEN_76573-1 [Araneus ventricosus]|uniref:DUF5641 domain-containing protein n=1 Tax=Araneus ventricosus TaxID=182803 RepID=A0A4Y2AH29_ARAVE|nr:hypothetical protein AVEN_76573-1 [Araneus ventricosus]